MSRRLLWLAMLVLGGCGGADVGVRVELALERSIGGDGDLLTVYALGPEYAKTAVSCSQPPAAQIDREAEMVLASAIMVLGGANPLTGTKEFSLDDIEAGTDRILLADVVDSATPTVRHGIGCVDGVTIERDKNTVVPLVIQACPGQPGC
ncbi:MAG: hypothetical protein JXR83_04515 [Deltaproteobacteria bacterium]|nr:hypothetical protein [Deltaproteobacteria bacterium]